MPNKILINSQPWEKRVALIDQSSNLREIYFERSNEKNIVGNVYKGKVVKILPGMQVAFVDIGMEKAGFLHVDDIDLSLLNKTNGLDLPVKDIENDDENVVEEERPRIEEILKKSDDIMVRIVRVPIGSKGARISSYMTLAGRFLVYMPGKGQINLSRKIEGEGERERLTQLLNGLKKESDGYIIRTVSEGNDEQDLNKDIKLLLKIWEDLQAKYQDVRAPALIYEELDILHRVVRDYLTDDIVSLVIDNLDDYKNICNFVHSYLPELENKIEFYDNEVNIFEAHGVEIEIGKALSPTVWLKSGGSIVIEQTEALTSIDVNTGSYVGKKNLEDTIVKTNLEAVKEIVYQIILRNIGGIIVIDFIDMQMEVNRDKVFKLLEVELKKDRAKNQILNFTEFGLLEMCRKRVRDSLQKTLGDACQYCEGKGFVKSVDTVCFEVFRELERQASMALPSQGNIVLNVSEPVGQKITEDMASYIEDLETRLRKKIRIEIDVSLHVEQYYIDIN